ncbi:YeeE/YedE family protein [Loktanella sp. M215]|uniref:YeeE/YedE family protein n=1 Tax=Loktanella sp. M215 TaxID=2675431 RepID=UPI001F4467E1|nr:YeeE/YedE family protein [Loktanella sp. M215]MCF7698926.1 YeeE/YedE family protein [Loktanella sp. M215]
MIETLGETTTLALIGLVGGILLGLSARLGRFCTLGAIEDAVYGHDATRLRMWGIAIGVAICGSFTLAAAGLLETERTIYLSFAFQPLASAVGGLMFGYGMALAGNCGYGALARLGGGDLRSFVIVLVMGLAAFATISGPLAYLRVAFFPQSQAFVTPGIAQGLAATLGLNVNSIGITIGLGVLAVTLSASAFRAERRAILWGTCVGLAVVSGWAGTQWVALNGFAPTVVESHTFAAPLGETMLYAMTASARSLSFGVGSVAGVLLGAFIGSLIKGHFRWEACEDPRELRRQIAGAAIMGVGAVLAMGCSIGQGLSAISVLAYSAPLVMAGIFAGAWIGLRQLITGFAHIA